MSVPKNQLNHDSSLVGTSYKDMDKLKKIYANHSKRSALAVALARKHGEKGGRFTNNGGWSGSRAQGGHFESGFNGKDRS